MLREGARVVQKSSPPGLRCLNRGVKVEKDFFAHELEQLRRKMPEEKPLKGAARWERLCLDEVGWILTHLCSEDLGALGVSHRAFRGPTALTCELRVPTVQSSYAVLLERRTFEPWWRAARAAELYALEDVVSAGGSHELVVSQTTGRLYSRGRGTCGQLGLGLTVETTNPRKVSFSSSSGRSSQLKQKNANKKIAHVAAGAYGSLAVDEDGDLYAFGKAAASSMAGIQQQVNNNNNDLATPRLVLFPRSTANFGGCGGPRIVACSAGTHHCLAVDSDGFVWSWGKNTHGQLGLGSVRAGPTPPRLVRSLAKATRCFFASAGAFHSLVIDKDGALYGFGLGADGRLGLGHSLNATLPERVLLPDSASKIIHCDAGVAHSACVDARGDLYAWGDPARGAVGHRDVEASRAPKRVGARRPRDHLHDNFSSSSSLDDQEQEHEHEDDADDENRAPNGQLASIIFAGGAGQHSTKKKKKKQPHRSHLGRVLKAKCSLVRTLALDDDGHLWSVGGHSGIRKVALPKKYKDAPIRDFACGSEDTVLVALASKDVYLDLGWTDAQPGTGHGSAAKTSALLKVKAYSCSSAYDADDDDAAAA
eukprot:CAMPEP_0118906832 /NCGR_PEP_ID=MMETSP1166-20130328/10554_1 /TAXON_ID=1104430 /ORGANISM="Chrysoreinhardia sp, Strain CCMP3193" /LENGTH=593 /DNA_ID=CAMNT_0006846189 /DNA_START=206 /DNA_END=1983 /DNA_ORIENTATION=-